MLYCFTAWFSSQRSPTSEENSVIVPHGGKQDPRPTSWSKTLPRAKGPCKLWRPLGFSLSGGGGGSPTPHPQPPLLFLCHHLLFSVCIWALASVTPPQGVLPRPSVLRERHLSLFICLLLCPSLGRELLDRRPFVFLLHHNVASSTYSPGAWQPQVLIQEMSNDSSRKRPQSLFHHLV